MREVICAHIGQAGVQIANASWELFCCEHGIEADGKLKLNLVDDDSEAFKTFFNEVRSGQFVPRCLSVDLEPSVIDEVRKGVYRNLFNPEYLLNGIEDGCSNFARGRFTVGKKYFPSSLDIIRKLVEVCDNLQGFFIVHSQGGGTGSGFTSLLMESLSIEYVKHLQYKMTVFPSPVLNVSIVEPYNCILNIKESTDSANIANAFSNEAIFNICTHLIDITSPTFNNINRVLSHLFSDITVSLRFESSLNSDLSQLGTNLIPYPRIHFVTSSHSPLISNERSEHELTNVDSITRDLFRPSHQLISCESPKTTYMSCVLQYRGDVNPQETNISLMKIKKHKNIQFVDWCPTGFKIGINCQPPSYVKGSEMATSNKSATLLANGSTIKQPLLDLLSRFDILFSKRSFVHWFVGEGMEEGEFNEARDEISTIIIDYEEVCYIPEVEEVEKSKEPDATNEKSEVIEQESHKSDTENEMLEPIPEKSEELP